MDGPLKVVARLALLGRWFWLTPVCAVALVAGLLLCYPDRELRGWVIDRSSAEPIAGARVMGPGGEQTSRAGEFIFLRVRPGDAIGASAEGYRPSTMRVGLSGEVVLQLEPRVVQLSVIDAETGESLAAQLRTTTRIAEQGPGRYSLSPARRDLAVLVSAAGFQEAMVLPNEQEFVQVKLARQLVGRVKDPSGQAVSRAIIIANGQVIPVTADGEFELPSQPPDGKFQVLAPGFLRRLVEMDSPDALDVRLVPHFAKGVYLSLAGVGHQPLLSRVLGLVEATELNTLVIDVKDDWGRVLYSSGVPQVRQIGASSSAVLEDPKKFLQELRRRGVYTIARIVAFKDDKLARSGARAGLDVAVKDLATGAVWVDLEGNGWVDPFQEAVWDYNIALAREAAGLGFDEIQFDYVRFPTDPGPGMSVENAVYSKPSTQEDRTQALRDFLSRARQALRLAGAFLSIDTYGYASFFDDDRGIGQNLRKLAPEVDYVSPMLYPSTFEAGLPGDLRYPQVLRHPYEVVYQGAREASRRLDGSGAVLRPWLQYFDDYPWATGAAYDAPQIEAQIRAAEAAGAAGWLLWDPTNWYARGGF